MKKIKIMLFSLLVLGVVGAALAFRVKFNIAYCTSEIPEGLTTCREAGAPQNVACPNPTASTTLAGNVDLCYTRPPAGQGCAGLRCITTTNRFKPDR